VPLTTHEGKVVHLYDDLLEGRIVAINLVFTRCTYSCPLETARLVQVQRILGDRLGRDVFLYSLSIDPEHDTPGVLAAYAQRYRVGPGWLFLTGKKEDIAVVSRKLGLLASPAANRDGHTAELVIGNVPAGQWMRISALDNPQLIARTIGNIVDGWQRGAPGASYAAAPALSFTKGQYLFSTRCAACHSVGSGDGIGPDLAGVTRSRDRGWLTRFIAAPDRVLAAGDPIAKELFARYKVNMPNLGLGEADAEAIIEYLGAQGAPGRSASASASGVQPDSQLPKPERSIP
jgi:protein SCO1/2